MNRLVNDAIRDATVLFHKQFIVFCMNDNENEKINNIRRIENEGRLVLEISESGERNGRTVGQTKASMIRN